MLSRQALFEDFLNLLTRHVKLSFDDEPLLLNREDRLKAVERIIAFRRRRETLFGNELFADAAWDILLDLYRAHLSERNISVSSACIAANVPPTTALRWLALLESRALISRIPDGRDRRRVYVSLAPGAMMSLNALIDGLVDTGSATSGSMSIAMER